MEQLYFKLFLLSCVTISQYKTAASLTDSDYWIDSGETGVIKMTFSGQPLEYTPVLIMIPLNWDFFKLEFEPY